MKTQNYEKFQIRGAIKEIMRNYALRTISIKNYLSYTGESNTTLKDIHSVKYDIMNGYIKVYNYNNKGKCGNPRETVDNNTYKEIYNVLESLVKKEMSIPFNVKRNILVKVNK